MLQRDVINNPVLDVGIYLLDDKIDNLPPADNLLDALTKIEDLLPKDLRDTYSTYVLYVTTQTKKSWLSRPERSKGVLE